MPGARRLLKGATARLAQHPSHFVVAFGSAFYLLVLIVTGWMVWEQRLLSIEKAGVNLRNMSVAMAEQADRVIASMDTAGIHLIDHVLRGHIGTAASPGYLESEELQATLSTIVSATPERFAFILADEHGRMLNASHKVPTPTTDITDRPSFQFLRAHPEIEGFVSKAMFNQYTGKPIFDVVHRLSGPDGVFRGVLIGTIQAAYLEQLFRSSTVARKASVELFHPDGSLLVRCSSLPPDTADLRETGRRASFPATDQGIIREVDAHDHVEHLAAVQRLPFHPLMIAVSEPLDEILASWRVRTVWIGGITALGCLATLITMILAVRRFDDQRRLADASAALTLDDERRRAGREIADQHTVFGMALDNMNEGLLMFDRSNRLLLANAAVVRMLEIQPGCLRPGMPVADVIRAVANVGNVSEHITAATDFYMRLVQRNIPAKFTRTLPDGRRLAANFAPHDNGWIITFEDMTDVRKADERIAHMAMHDALTGLPNRSTLRARTEEALAAIHDGGSFAIACLDLDHFKDVNDVLGHPAGDRLLCEVAARIRSAIRPADIVARLGGDEFAIVLNNIASRVAIADLATRLVAAIGAPYELEGQAVFVGASIGIAIAAVDGGDPDTLIKNADMALYRAKNEGRGRFVFFEPAMLQHIVERQRIGHELLNALSAGELDLYYQPIVKVESRRIVGFEALMRWHHPTRGTIPPVEFIPVAEENGFIVQLGKWALHKACLEATRWPDAIKLAVNLSPVQFRSGTLVETVAEALESSGLAADRLELEITESTMMIDTNATLATLQELKALGVRIAMDDFGTGYSSLAYLQRFPFDKIKIDRAFVRDIGQATNLAIIRAVTGIAESLKIVTTAEGVETEAQFSAVKHLRCVEVQGYLFSQPVPSHEIAAMLAVDNTDAAPADASMLSALAV